MKDGTFKTDRTDMGQRDRIAKPERKIGQIG